MTILQAWREVRRDPEWKKKAGLAVLVYLIPYVGPYIVMGYGVNYAQAVAQRVDGGRLPDWNAFGDHGRTALKAFVVSFVYSLPIMVLVFPLSFGMAAMSIVATEAESFGPSLVVFAVSMIAIVLLSFAYVPVTYAGLSALVATGTIEGAFAFGDVWRRARANAGLLLATSGRIIGAGMLAAAVPLAIGVPAFVIPLAAAEAGGDTAGAAFAAGIGVYLLSIVVVIALAAVVQLVAYRLLAEYVRTAYGFPRPPLETAA